MLDLNSTPKVYKQIYKKKVSGLLMLYNPYSLKGFILLHQQFVSLYKHINGINKIRDFFEISYKLGLNLRKKKILDLFSNLFTHDIINFKNQDYFPQAIKKNKIKILTVWLDLTNQCNFRCTYCFTGKNQSKMNEETIENILKDLIITQKRYKYKKISLCLAGGEPLLEFSLINKIIERIKKIADYKQIFNIGIITNGSLLTEKVANYFKNNNIRITISLDGLDRYNNITRKFNNGSNTFKYVKKGILIALKHKILNNIDTTLTAKNIKGLIALTKFSLKNNIKINWSFYKKVDKYTNKETYPDTDKFIPIFRKVLKLIYSHYENNDINHSPLFDYKISDLVKLLFNLTTNNCSAGKAFFTITTEGQVKFCPYSNKALIPKLGKSILKAHQAYADLIDSTSVNEVLVCQNCLWKYVCSGGCMLERLYLDKNTPSLRCKLYKSLIPTILEFEAKRIINNSLLPLYK